MKRPTSQQVAKQAGVSRTTVSFVLNNAPLSENISEETRERVLNAARELGYVPDAAARTLASGQTRTLGLVLPDSHHLKVDAFIPQLLYSLTEVSNERGFRVIVEGLRESGGDPYRSLIHAKQIDGLVVLNPRLDDVDSSLPELVESDFPVVFVGSVDHPQEYKVTQNPLMEAAVKRLIDLGHERIAHITYAPVTFQGALDRLEVYRCALREAGLEVDDALVRQGNYSAQSGFEAMGSLLEGTAPFTALFAGNDTVALGAMAALHQAGLRIPEDVAVVGYDDIPTAAYAVPPLTTVRTNPKEQGRRAGELLISLVQGERPAERNVQVGDAELIIRASCGGTNRTSNTLTLNRMPGVRPTT